MLRKIGKYWHIDISHPSIDKRFRKTTKTADKSFAQKMHDKWYREILEDSIGGYRTKSIEYQKFTIEFLKYSKINHSPRTTETYRFALAKLNSILPENMLLKNINSDDIERMKEHINNKTTYNIYYNHLKAAFNYAIKWKYIKSNPLTNVNKFKINEKTRTNIPIPDFYKLIDTIKNDNNRPFADLLLFMVMTGARRSELLNLKWEDIDLENKYIILRNTKGKQDAVIPINSDALIEILNRRSRETKPFNYLPDFVTKKFKYYSRLIGLPKEIVLHSVRHTTATFLIESGEDPMKIQQLLRHKDLKTTIQYTHTAPSFLNSAIEKTSELVKDLV